MGATTLQLYFPSDLYGLLQPYGLQLGVADLLCWCGTEFQRFTSFLARYRYCGMAQVCCST